MTHAMTRVHGETYNWHTRIQITAAMVRCTCGQVWRAQYLTDALVAHDAHLDRMVAKGSPVRRD